MNKINDLKPERLVTDCLSCRLQFNQLLPYKVYHPIEILRDAIGLNQAEKAIDVKSSSKG
jgi:glycerol-3-phosphate dehydrogenase subunit C